MKASMCATIACALLLLLSLANPALAQQSLTFRYCDTTAETQFNVARVLASNATADAGVPITFTLLGLLDSDLSGGTYSLLLTRDTDAQTLLFSQFGNLAQLVSGAWPTAGDAAVNLTWTLPSSVPLLPSDTQVGLRLEAVDQTEAELMCLIIELPVGSQQPTPQPEEPKHSNKGLGYACALISVVFFGTNFLPVKAFDTGDGVFFQWLLCMGVWLCGLIVQLIRQSAFEPFAMVGGMLWCLGNMMTVPIIQLIGLGVGMCIWGTATLIMGWASGRFGMFGIHSQKVENQAMNIIGLLLCVASMGLMFQVKSVKEEQEAARKSAGHDHMLLEGDSLNNPTASYQLSKRAEYDSESMGGAPGAEAGVAPPTASWISTLSPGMKRVLGISMSLVAGCLYGLNFTPPQYLIDSGKGKSSAGIDYVFSHFSGILLTSTAYLLAYCAYKRNQPWVSSRIVLPGMCSGIGWAIAQISWFVANDQIHFVGTFPIVSTGPGIVATLCSIVLYKEIQGRRNYAFLGATALVVFTGVILIALSLPAGS